MRAKPALPVPGLAPVSPVSVCPGVPDVPVSSMSPCPRCPCAPVSPASPVSPCPDVPVPCCPRAPVSPVRPPLQERCRPWGGPSGPAGAAGALGKRRSRSPGMGCSVPAGAGPMRGAGKAWMPRPCSGELESCHLQKVKKYGEKEHPAACWRLLFKWLWKPVSIADSDTGSLRLAGVWMLRVDTCQDPTDTCQDPLCSACQFKITAFVAQHCNSDASFFRDFSFLSPVPQRYVCCQSMLSLFPFPFLQS